MHPVDSGYILMMMMMIMMIIMIVMMMIMKMLMKMCFSLSSLAFLFPFFSKGGRCSQSGY